MPHCIIECSDNFSNSSKLLIDAVHQGALASELFSEDDIKTRLVTYDAFQTGTTEKPFVHVVAKILAGRSSEQKSTLSHVILSELQAINLGMCSITVEVVDIDTSSYAKVVM